MKKLLSILVLAVLCISFTACNEDVEKNDPILTQELVGDWMLNFDSDNTSNRIIYRFGANGGFSYITESSKASDITAKMSYIEGTWNVYKGVLQLKYDLETYRASGLSEAESSSLYDAFSKENMLLNDMNSSNKAYGATITFGTSGANTTLRLSTINGTFIRTTIYYQEEK